MRTTIGESCTLHARIGWQGLTKSEYLDEGDFYLVTGVDFNNNLIDFDSCHFVTRDRYDQDKNIQLRQDDILVTKDGTIGKVAIIEEPLLKPATLNSGVFVVRPRNSATLLPKYLMLVLMSNHFGRFIEQIKVGCTVAHLNQEKFLHFSFPLPSVREQSHIIEVVLNASTIIEQRKRQLSQLDTIIKARFVELFGNYDLSPQKQEWVPISSIGTVVGGATPRTNISEFWNGEYRWISPAELEMDSGIIYDSVKKVTKAGIDSCSLQELPVGTVILTSRAPIGKVAIAGKTFYCNQGFKNIICNDKVIPRFLYSLLLFNTNYLNSLGRGATFKEISKSIVENIRIPLPAVQQQMLFVHFVNEVDKSKIVVQKALDKAQQLFDSLMQEYFG